LRPVKENKLYVNQIETGCEGAESRMECLL
jgi:hypothetical protein